ncbi:MAG: ribose 5-phosphate isomerase [Bacteroidota bacterium]|jgi:ribose 5-phosphate isomerase B
MKVAIGSDHAGVELKAALVEMLSNDGKTMFDKGPMTEDSVDYPDYGHAVASAVESGEVDLGIVICGSGNGINMTTNKHQDIRSALCWLPEIAALARQHNDANILALPARFVSIEEGLAIAKEFFAHEFEGGRHERRVGKISCGA